MKSFAPHRVTYFVSTGSQPRVRRATDVSTAVVGALLVTGGLAVVGDSPPWESAFRSLIVAAPAWVGSVLSFGYALSLMFGLVIVGALIFGGRERRGAFRDVAIAILGATAIAVLLSLIVNGAWPYVLPELGLDEATPRFPVLRVAVVSAILISASPHLTRPMRRLGWAAIVVSSVAAVGLGYGDPSDSVAALGIGLFTASLWLAIVGSPRGYPDPDSVADCLELLGVESGGLEICVEQSWGVRRFTATGSDGAPIDIKVHGRDAFDSQLAARLWRTLWYREMGQTLSYSRLQAVEHEALITLLAGGAGVPVPEIIAVGEPSAEIALLAVSGGGTRLAELEVGNVTDEMLIGLWSDLGLLHQKGLSHGSFTTDSVCFDDRGHIFTNFSLGSVGAGPADRATDIVEMLFSMALLSGVERAVRTAVAGLGEAAVVDVLPYLQLPAVSPSSRKAAEEPKKLIAALVASVTDVTDSDPPELVKLRRVTPRNVIMTALLLLTAWALIPLFTGVDYAEVWAVLKPADWWVIFVGLVVGQTQFVPQATATMFAVPRALPFWPLLVLQTASKYLGLAVPSAAGRIAMNAAFLHKFGVPVTVAVAQGAIDGFSGFLVQVTILLLAFLTGDYQIDIDTSQVQWGLVLLIVALIAIGTVVAVLRIKSIKERVVPVIKQAWGALMNVLRQPVRAIGLLGSNFVYWNILGLTLWLMLRAIGVDLDYGIALVVAVATDLLGGFVPIPGGIGVAEAVMTGFLVTLGVDESSAFGATVAYRVVTFYLPALEGFFGMRWLERNEYL